MLKRLFFFTLLLVCLNGYAFIHVQDDWGNSVVLKKTAKRIVTLAPNITEMLYAIGAGQNVVGTANYTDYPKSAKKIKRVGTYADPDLETIVALHPNIIFVWGPGNPPRLIEKLKALGLTVYVMQPESISDIAKDMMQLGIITGKIQQAKKIQTHFNHQLNALVKQYALQKPVTVFYQIWREPLISIGKNNLINNAIQICGGKNITQDLIAPYARVSLETVLSRDPDVIITSDQQAMLFWQHYPFLKAVKSHHIYFIPADDIQRYSPRILRGTKMLCHDLNRVRIGA